MDVKRFKVGDEVYVRLPERDRGEWQRSSHRSRVNKLVDVDMPGRCVGGIRPVRRDVHRSQAQVAVIRRRGVGTTGGIDGAADFHEVQWFIGGEDGLCAFWP